VDQETQKIKARLDVLETALAAMARRDPGILQLLRVTLTAGYESAVSQATERPEAAFPRNVQVEPRPLRDYLAEKANVDAYQEFLQKLAGTA
jgi:hypothetical protein